MTLTEIEFVARKLKEPPPPVPFLEQRQAQDGGREMNNYAFHCPHDKENRFDYVTAYKRLKAFLVCCRRWGCESCSNDCGGPQELVTENQGGEEG